VVILLHTLFPKGMPSGCLNGLISTSDELLSSPPEMEMREQGRRGESMCVRRENVCGQVGGLMAVV
jgi:hypothetical protein